jgi:hypothetical protein
VVPNVRRVADKKSFAGRGFHVRGAVIGDNDGRARGQVVHSEVGAKYQCCDWINLDPE